jgi:hypothetical protein
MARHLSSWWPAARREPSRRLHSRLGSQQSSPVREEGRTVDHHVRESVLAAVVTAADRRLDGSLPWSDVPDAERLFRTPDNLLSILQMRWHTHLAALIEEALDAEPLDLAQAVIDAWRKCAVDMPGVRRIFDAHADTPALQRAQRKDWELLASARGLAATEDPRVDAVGRKIEELARSQSQLPPLAAINPQRPPGAAP